MTLIIHTEGSSNLGPVKRPPYKETDPKLLALLVEGAGDPNDHWRVLIPMKRKWQEHTFTKQELSMIRNAYGDQDNHDFAFKKTGQGCYMIEFRILRGSLFKIYFDTIGQSRWLGVPKV